MLTLSKAINKYYQNWIEKGESNLNFEEAISLRKEIEDVVGLEEMYKIEETTTERVQD